MVLIYTNEISTDSVTDNFYNLIIENGGEVKRDDRCDGFGELCHHSCCFLQASIAARKQRTLWFCIAMWTVYTRSLDASRAFMDSSALCCRRPSDYYILIFPRGCFSRLLCNGWVAGRRMHLHSVAYANKTTTLGFKRAFRNEVIY